MKIYARTLLAMVTIILTALAGLASGVLPRCDGGMEGVAGPPADEIYAQIQAALAREGEVVVVSETVIAEGRSYPPGLSHRFWLDVRDQTARIERTLLSLGEERVSTTIIVGSLEYRVDERGQLHTRSSAPCNGGIPGAVALYSPCFPSPSRDLGTETRSQVEFDGRDAILIVTRGESGGEDSTVRLVRRLYVDAQTYLPLALVEEGKDDYARGPVVEFSSITRFMHTFIPPPDFFSFKSAAYEIRPVPLSPP